MTGHVTCHVHKYSIVSFLILCIILTNGHTNVHIIAKQLPNSIVQCITVNYGTSQHHCDLLTSYVLGWDTDSSVGSSPIQWHSGTWTSSWVRAPGRNDDSTCIYTAMLFPLPIPHSLVVQLARDIQSDFYPHFTSVFPVLVSVCLCHDPQLIQVLMYILQ